MKTLSKSEAIQVTGGDAREAGRAVGNAVQAAGEAAARAGEAIIEAWLPIAKKINTLIR